MSILSAKKVSEQLRVSPTSVSTWAKLGLFPNARLSGIKSGKGKIWLIPESDLKNFRRPKRGKPFSINPGKYATAKRKQREKEKNG